MADIHPDFLVAGLRAELAEVERLPDTPSKAAQIAAISKELERADRLERPAATAEEPDRAVPDTRSWYLDALHAEKASSHPDRHAEIDAEIARVTAELNRPVEDDDDSASAESSSSSHPDRHAEIDAEIARVTAELNRPVEDDDDSAEAAADAPKPRGRRATTPKE